MPELIGKVVDVLVKGEGCNSAELQFTLDSVRESTTFIVTSLPEFEPQVFISMAALLAAAYYAKQEIYIEYSKKDGHTPRCTMVALKSMRDVS